MVCIDFFGFQPSPAVANLVWLLRFVEEIAEWVDSIGSSVCCCTVENMLLILL